MNVTAHQEKEKNEETQKGRRKETENRRPSSQVCFYSSCITSVVTMIILSRLLCLDCSPVNAEKRG